MEGNARARLFYPMDEAAALIGVKRTSLYKLVNAGKLHRIHIGRKALITTDSLARYCASLNARQSSNGR